MSPDFNACECVSSTSVDTYHRSFTGNQLLFHSWHIHTFFEPSILWNNTYFTLHPKWQREKPIYVECVFFLWYSALAFSINRNSRNDFAFTYFGPLSLHNVTNNRKPREKLFSCDLISIWSFNAKQIKRKSYGRKIIQTHIFHLVDGVSMPMYCWAKERENSWKAIHSHVCDVLDIEPW